MHGRTSLTAAARHSDSNSSGSNFAPQYRESREPREKNQQLQTASQPSQQTQAHNNIIQTQSQQQLSMTDNNQNNNLLNHNTTQLSHTVSKSVSHSVQNRDSLTVQSATAGLRQSQNQMNVSGSGSRGSGTPKVRQMATPTAAQNSNSNQQNHLQQQRAGTPTRISLLSNSGSRARLSQSGAGLPLPTSQHSHNNIGNSNQSQTANTIVANNVEKSAALQKRVHELESQIVQEREQYRLEKENFQKAVLTRVQQGVNLQVQQLEREFESRVNTEVEKRVRQKLETLGVTNTDSGTKRMKLNESGGTSRPPTGGIPTPLATVERTMCTPKDFQSDHDEVQELTNVRGSVGANSAATGTSKASNITTPNRNLAAVLKGGIQITTSQNIIGGSKNDGTVNQQNLDLNQVQQQLNLGYRQSMGPGEGSSPDSQSENYNPNSNYNVQQASLSVTRKLRVSNDQNMPNPKTVTNLSVPEMSESPDANVNINQNNNQNQLISRRSAQILSQALNESLSKESKVNKLGVTAGVSPTQRDPDAISVDASSGGQRDASSLLTNIVSPDVIMSGSGNNNNVDIDAMSQQLCKTDSEKLHFTSPKQSLQSSPDDSNMSNIEGENTTVTAPALEFQVTGKKGAMSKENQQGGKKGPPVPSGGKKGPPVPGGGKKGGKKGPPVPSGGKKGGSTSNVPSEYDSTDQSNNGGQHYPSDQQSGTTAAKNFGKNNDNSLLNVPGQSDSQSHLNQPQAQGKNNNSKGPNKSSKAKGKGGLGLGQKTGPANLIQSFKGPKLRPVFWVSLHLKQRNMIRQNQQAQTESDGHYQPNSNVMNDSSIWQQNQYNDSSESDSTLNESDGNNITSDDGTVWQLVRHIQEKSKLLEKFETFYQPILEKEFIVAQAKPLSAVLPKSPRFGGSGAGKGGGSDNLQANLAIARARVLTGVDEHGNPINNNHNNLNHGAIGSSNSTINDVRNGLTPMNCQPGSASHQIIEWTPPPSQNLSGRQLTILDQSRAQHLNIVFKPLPSPGDIYFSIRGQNNVPPLCAEHARVLLQEAFITEAEQQMMSLLHKKWGFTAKYEHEFYIAQQNQLNSSQQPGAVPFIKKEQPPTGRFFWAVPEQYFVAIKRSHKKVKSILRVWVALGSVEQSKREIDDQINILKQALNLLVTHWVQNDNTGSSGPGTGSSSSSTTQFESNKLLELFSMMLVVGNRLNAGTVRGNATGFSLDSLTKFGEMKNAAANKSLLSFILEFVNYWNFNVAATQPTSSPLERESSGTVLNNNLNINMNNSMNNTNSSANAKALINTVNTWKTKVSRARRVCLDDIKNKAKELEEEIEACRAICEENDRLENPNPPLKHASPKIYRFSDEIKQLVRRCDHQDRKYDAFLKYYCVPKNVKKTSDDAFRVFEDLFTQIINCIEGAVGVAGKS